MDPGKPASEEQLLEPAGCSLTRPGRPGLQRGRAGHPALPPRCFILATDCTNPRANIELAWILSSGCKHCRSPPLASAPCLRRAFRCRWPQARAGQAAQGAGRTESVPQEPDSESSDLPLRCEDVPLGWKGLEGPCGEARRWSQAPQGMPSRPPPPPGVPGLGHCSWRMTTSDGSLEPQENF